VAPPDFEASLLARIRNEKAPRRFWQRQSWWLYGFEGFSWQVAGVTALITVFIVGTVSYPSPTGLNHVAATGLCEARHRPTMKPPGMTVEEAGSTPDGSRDLTNAAPQRASASGGGRAAAADKWTTPFADPADSEFVEFLVPVSGDRQLIVSIAQDHPHAVRPAVAGVLYRNVSH
jgi:hypothetical protein